MTDNDKHNFTWLETKDDNMISVVPILKASCSSVKNTILNYLTANRKKDEAIESPKYIVNANEFNLTFDYTAFVIDLSGNCQLNIALSYVNATGIYAEKNLEDVIVLGYSVFNSFQGLQWDFDTKKLAYILYPPEEPNHPVDPLTPSGGSGFPTWLLIVLIVGGLVVIGAVGFICYREKKLKEQLNTGGHGYSGLD